MKVAISGRPRPQHPLSFCNLNGDEGRPHPVMNWPWAAMLLLPENRTR
jgi:hypothetical protein